MDREYTVGFQARMLSNAIKRAMDNSALKKYADELTGVHGWVLGYLYRSECAGLDIFQRNLEQDFCIRRSTVTQILQLMEKNGLIERKSVEQDARLKQLRLTDRGRELHLTVVRDIEAMEARIRSGIPEAEMQMFFATIEKMKRNITETDSNKPDINSSREDRQ